jgi:hypothetical protein
MAGPPELPGFADAADNQRTRDGVPVSCPAAPRGYGALLATEGKTVRAKTLLLATACTSAAALAAVGIAFGASGNQRVINVLEVGTADVNLDGQGEPKAGDRFYSKSTLYGWAGTKRGKRIGRDEVLCTFTSVNFEHGHASAFCTAQFFLPGGSMVGQAFIRFTEGPLRTNVPLIGGTGVYANATGSVHIRDIGSGDSGNTALTFHIAP